MTFERSWALLLALLPFAWAAYEWSHTRRHLGLILRALSFAAIFIAIAEPRLTVDETKLAVAVLADTSESTTDADLVRGADIAEEIQSEQGRHWTTVIPFARSTRPLSSDELTGDVGFGHTTGEAGRGTDLEAAIQEGIAALPEAMVPRLVLITDGKETEGSLSRAAWQAKQLDIPIDTYLLPGRRKPELRLEGVSFPALAYTGEQFPIDVVIESPSTGQAQLELAAEGIVLGKSNVTLSKGPNPVRLHASLNTPGALDLSLRIDSPQLGDLRYDHALEVRRPKVLYFSNDSAAENEHLTGALSAASFEVTQANVVNGVRLNDYQLVIFNNWDLDSLPESGKQEIADYVRQGGGLLVVAGDRNIYREPEEGAPEDILNAALPATLAPPRSPEGTAVVLIVDKSSSMEGRKMELARLASIGVVDNLRPIDTVGVLQFDNTFEWAVPIRKVDNKTLINRLIGGITPDGGTQIAPALAEAYNRILPTQASYRHIVLLTDGISEEGNSLAVARSARDNDVTISTVGLGQDVNRNYLARVAEYAGGSAYVITDLEQLERILLKDVKEHTGSTTVERSLKPDVQKDVEVLDGVPISAAPDLKGYVRFDAKPSAETILTINGEGEDDPLLTRWQYGLGRAAVFASDAKPRWAWTGFPGRGMTPSGPTLPATCCPTRRTAKPAPSSTAPTANSSSATGWVPRWRSRPRSRKCSSSVPTGSSPPLMSARSPRGPMKDDSKSATAKACSAYCPPRNPRRSRKPASIARKPSWSITARTKPCCVRYRPSPADALSPNPATSFPAPANRSARS